MSWEEYKAWAQGRLTGCRRAAERDTTVTFSCPLEGDLITLTLEDKTVQDGRLAVVVSFDSKPY